jgi:hypothetical protein
MKRMGPRRRDSLERGVLPCDEGGVQISGRQGLSDKGLIEAACGFDAGSRRSPRRGRAGVHASPMPRPRGQALPDFLAVARARPILSRTTRNRMGVMALRGLYWVCRSTTLPDKAPPPHPSQRPSASGPGTREEHCRIRQALPGRARSASPNRGRPLQCRRRAATRRPFEKRLDNWAAGRSAGAKKPSTIGGRRRRELYAVSRIPEPDHGDVRRRSHQLLAGRRRSR